MTAEILFIQGAGKGTHRDWDSKLVASLEDSLGPNYEVSYPEMPREDDPDFEAWKTELLDRFARRDDGAILIGHSIGGTLLLHALADETCKLKPGALMLLAAPFIGTGGWELETCPSSADACARLAPTTRVFIYQGTEDETVDVSHGRLHARAIPHATLRIIEGRDHQLNNDLSMVAADIASLATG